MEQAASVSARRIQITGVVQGVGFRPFVYNLATRLGLSGWVLNSSSGVEIEAAGPAQAMDEFVARLQTEAPPLARIERIAVSDLPPSGVDGLEPGSLAALGTGSHATLGTSHFTIRHSEARPGEFQPISPDITICEDCLRELLDPRDRRYRYPFINCTNCGPRFTIIRDIPYDRPQTTMAPFVMCPDCQAEYDDPTNRRFHAQPNACAVCGPRVWLEAPAAGPVAGGEPDSAAHVDAARELLRAGSILAVKGLGGFHLACDATNDDAVRRLRERKGRVDKPFAIMSLDLATVRRTCELSEAEAELLSSRQRPIVLLDRRGRSPVSPLVAPNNATLGVMLPYTPLHYLLLQPAASGEWQPLALVMTSGNYSEEPIATGNDEARERLTSLADGFLLHDRDIHARCDDSVTRVFQAAELPVRRSRGYAPYPVHLPFSVRQILATGAELKNTFCLTRDRYAFLSQHIGDMENYETLRFYEGMVAQLARTFRVQPEVIACDKHPAYLASRHARRMVSESAGSLELVEVQHHHAHVAACMAENGLTGEQQVIGVAFDGTGYGSDGAIWGGEFLVADYVSFRRAAHLKYVPLPGGDAAIRRPYRVALAHLWAAGLAWDEALPPVAVATPTERGLLAQQLERGVNCVPTSSIGRLFDAVSALAGVRQCINYEAQAAIELEMLVQDGVAVQASGSGAHVCGAHVCGAYAFGLGEEIDPAPVIQAAAGDARAGVAPGVIATRFHSAVAEMIASVCARLREETGLNEVVLSGGVFQNVTLLGRVLPLLQAAGFAVHTHHLVPPNDAGVSLGQAMVANARLD